MTFLRQQVTSPVVIALGSNLGERAENLRAALAAIAALDGVSVTAVSGLVESHAVKPDGVDASSPDYLNAVILVQSTVMPEVLLAALQQIETAHGRVRVERWGDRTLDLDIVSFGALEWHSDALTLPHPRAAQRAFVVVPWLQADPAAWLHGHGRVDELQAADSDEVWAFRSEIWPYPENVRLSPVLPQTDRHPE